MAEQRPPGDEADLRRAIAWAGAVLTAVGVVGLFVRPNLYVVWVFLIVFAAGCHWLRPLGSIDAPSPQCLSTWQDVVFEGVSRDDLHPWSQLDRLVLDRPELSNRGAAVLAAILTWLRT
jgi:hypothetical protein